MLIAIYGLLEPGCIDLATRWVSVRCPQVIIHFHMTMEQTGGVKIVGIQVILPGTYLQGKQEPTILALKIYIRSPYSHIEVISQKILPGKSSVAILMQLANDWDHV